MRLPDEQEERGMGIPVIYTIVAVSVFILIILAVVFMSNTRQSGREAAKNKDVEATPSATPAKEGELAEGEADIETLYRENKLRAEDLDFWDMYSGSGAVTGEDGEENQETDEEQTSASPDKSPGASASPGISPGALSSPGTSPDPSASPTPTHEPTEEEMAASGDYVQVILRDGTKEWIEISEDIPRYTYDFTNLRISDGKMAY